MAERALLRIDPRSPLPFATAAAGTIRPESSGQHRFEVASGKSGTRAASVRSAAPLATLDAILALQQEDHPSERRRRSARRGREILDGLDGLKAVLLTGRVPATELGRVVRGLTDRRESSGDPELDAIVDAIELRARVELAKLGRPDIV